MTNYYVELGLNRSASIEELEKQLNDLQRKWTSRAGNAPFGSEFKQKAERMVLLIREASDILLIKDKRAKYDKEIDKAPSTPTPSRPETSSQQPSVNVDSITGVATFEDLAEQFYDSDNYRQAIAVIKKAMETGNYSVYLYRILAMCYADNGDDNSAFAALQNMLRKFGDDPDAHLCVANLCLQSISGHRQDAKRSIEWLINSGHGDNGTVAALDIRYDIENGDLSLADSKIKEYMAKNSSDQNFRQMVSYAYANYADNQATTIGGNLYFLSEDNLDNWLSITEKALDIYSSPNLKQAYAHNKSLKDKVFVPDNWQGLLCGIGLALSGFNSPGAAMMGVLFLALTVFMAYTSFVPRWMFGYYEYSGHLRGVYEAGRIINIVSSFLLRLVIWIFKFIIGLVFAFMGA